MKKLLIAAVLAAIVALLLWVVPAFGIPELTINAIPYPVTVSLGWSQVTNPLVAGFNIYCNTNLYVVPGGGSTGVTITNLWGPGDLEFSAQTYALSGAVSAITTNEVCYCAPVRNMKITCHGTNLIVQKTRDFKSWISIPSLIVTNDGQTAFYRAITPWP